MNLLSTQPKDAVIGEKLGPAMVEPAVQEEQEESCVRMKSPDGRFGFSTEEEQAFLSTGCVMHYSLRLLAFVIYYMDIQSYRTSKLYFLNVLFFLKAKSIKNNGVWLFTLYYNVNIVYIRHDMPCIHQISKSCRWYQIWQQTTGFLMTFCMSQLSSLSWSTYKANSETT